MIESYPEVCFRGLLDQQLSHKKKTAAGVGERLEALGCHLETPGEVMTKVTQDLTGKSRVVMIDDVLDAIALGVTAWWGQKELFYLPENDRAKLETDNQELPMGMAYWAEESPLPVG